MQNEIIIKLKNKITINNHIVPINNLFLKHYNTSMLKAVGDPGFPRGEGVNSVGGRHLPIIWHNFWPKTAWK